MASNCSGARLLSEAGILGGKHATTWAGGEKALAAAYPKVKVEVNKNVVVDDKVITSTRAVGWLFMRTCGEYFRICPSGACEVCSMLKHSQ